MNDYKAALNLAHQESLRFLEALRDSPADAEIDQATARSRLVTDLPDTGLPDEDVIAELITAAKGGIPRQAGGRFFGFVMGGIHPAGVAADWLSSAWDDAPGTPLAAPFGCAVDRLAGEWALDLMDLPREASVGIVTGATMGNFVGACAARHALLRHEGWDVEAQGLFGAPEIHVVTGDAHPTMLLALRMAGFGAARRHIVPLTEDGAIRADALAEVLAGLEGPILICSQAGHINTSAFDPFPEICALAKEHGAWVHVDGAFGLWAQASPALRHLTKGVELADSWSVDAHKLLNTPYDGAFAIVRDRDAHAGAMSLAASYLPQQEGARDPSHFVPELSRRARGTAIYATIRKLGRQGVADAIEKLCANTKLMAELLTAEDGITCLNDVVFNQAVFSFEGASPDDVALTVRQSGEAWVQAADWQGQRIMRCSVADHSTTEEDVERAASAIINAYRELARKYA
ncbi:aspartate aminotransferase family protein [Parvularcula marina]|uniref:pyridoxal phosphate-dependent decarboxylase family protein n=1 Tax=Parvularcula marina TaxID=2292771 RepID=UPI003514CBB0